MAQIKSQQVGQFMKLLQWARRRHGFGGAVSELARHDFLNKMNFLLNLIP
jgi:hypothetical protein